MKKIKKPVTKNTQTTVELLPIRTPITYEMVYTRYLNSVIAAAAKDFTKQYHEMGVFTEYGALNAFQIALDNMDFNQDFVSGYYDSLGKYHDRQFNFVMKQAANVKNITARLSSDSVNHKIKTFIDQNIALIKTIETRLHDQVYDIIRGATTATDIDRQKIYKEIIKRFGVSKSNAKRIARDQSSKFIASMTEDRHKQVSIKQYRWLGAEDRRERPTHVANNNQIFSYNVPPSITGNPGHDVNCRCVAIGILSKAMISHLQNTFGVLS